MGVSNVAHDDMASGADPSEGCVGLNQSEELRVMSHLVPGKHNSVGGLTSVFHCELGAN